MSEAADRYQERQRGTMLAAILWVVLGASLLLGWFNLQFGTWASIISLFSLALLPQSRGWLIAAPIAAIGWITPISLFASMMLTTVVLSVIAART